MRSDKRCPFGRLLWKLCVLPARIRTGYITDFLETALPRPASWPVSTPPCALTAHADIRFRCPLCPRIHCQGVAPDLCIFQLSRCRSRVLLRSYLAGFMSGVSLVTIADGVGLSPFNMTALTASRLSLVANQLRHARPSCPFHVTIHAQKAQASSRGPGLLGLRHSKYTVAPPSR